MRVRPYAPLVLVLVATVLAACAGTGAGPTDGLAPVPITDFKMVAGKWDGLVSGLSAKRDDGDWAEMTISPDGTYDFGVYRTIGVFGGRGTFTLSDGKLQMRGDRGSATYALYQGGGKRVLQVQAMLSDGRPLTAKLTAKE
jgi:hypothetical protein